MPDLNYQRLFTDFVASEYGLLKSVRYHDGKSECCLEEARRNAATKIREIAMAAEPLGDVSFLANETTETPCCLWMVGRPRA